MDRATQAIEKKRWRLKSFARPAAFQAAQALEMGMQVRNNALETAGFFETRNITRLIAMPGDSELKLL